MTATETTTAWTLRGTGYEFCNCQPGCTCHFSGFPTSPDGSCKTAIAHRIVEGYCGDVDLSGIDLVVIVDWPTAIHDGNGKAMLVVPPEVSHERCGCLVEIFTGRLGGLWSVLGATFEIVAVVRADVEIDDAGMHSGFRINGVGEAIGSALKHPATGEERQAAIVHDDGIIWRRGECGVGSFHVETEGIALDFTDSSWIHFQFDWTNQ